MPMLSNLRPIRESRMLSQVELAQRAGVMQATISRIETGQAARFDTARKLARALRVKPAALVSPTNRASRLE
jgi:predicted transcriptional regulator